MFNHSFPKFHSVTHKLNSTAICTVLNRFDCNTVLTHYFIDCFLKTLLFSRCFLFKQLHFQKFEKITYTKWAQKSPLFFYISYKLLLFTQHLIKNVC